MEDNHLIKWVIYNGIYTLYSFGRLIILVPQEEIREMTVMWQNDGENAGHDLDE